jgi:endoglucanase
MQLTKVNNNTLFTDEKEQQKIYSLWITLSDSLKRYPESMLAYELLNEAVAENPDD